MQSLWYELPTRACGRIDQRLDAAVASQGESIDDALANLREALKLHFQPPVATATP